MKRSRPDARKPGELLRSPGHPCGFGCFPAEPNSGRTGRLEKQFCVKQSVSTPANSAAITVLFFEDSPRSFKSFVSLKVKLAALIWGVTSRVVFGVA